MKQKILLFVLAVFLSFNINAQLPSSVKELKPLLIGSKIPDTKIFTSKNGEISTKKLFNKKQTILVVYRGGWCPFCNRQLEGIGKITDELIDMDYQIIAVSPDSHSSEDSSKYAQNYTIASDSSTELIRNLGIAYQAPEKYGKILSKASNGKNTNIIPAPSVFILDTEGEILFEHISTDYKKRLNSELLKLIAKGYKK